MNAVVLGHEALKMTNKIYGPEKTLDECSRMGHEVLKMTIKNVWPAEDPRQMQCGGAMEH